MSERKGILGAGNWIVDHVKVIDAWPNQDTVRMLPTGGLAAHRAMS